MLVNYKTMVLFVKIWNLFEQAPRNGSRQRFFVESGFICGLLSPVLVLVLVLLRFCFVHFVRAVSLCSWLACPYAPSHSLARWSMWYVDPRPCWTLSPVPFPLIIQWVFGVSPYELRISLDVIYEFLITAYFVVLFVLLTLVLITWLPIWVGLMIDKLSLMSSGTKKKYVINRDCRLLILAWLMDSKSPTHQNF